MRDRRRVTAAALALVIALAGAPGAAMDVRQSAPPVERILHGLRAASVVDRLQALNAITQFNLDVPATELAALVDDRREDPAVRELAGRTLMRVAPATAMNSLRIVLILPSEPESLRLLALEAAGRERDLRSLAFVLSIAGGRSFAEPLRLAAMRTLAEFWPVAIPDPLLSVLADRMEPSTIRRAAASALITLADRSALRALLSAIDEPDVELARLAAGAVRNVLGGDRQTRDPSPPPADGATFDRLRAAWARGTEAQDLRRALVQAIAATGDGRAPAFLLATAETDPSPDVRIAAVEGLRFYPDPGVATWLATSIDRAGTDPGVRAVALLQFALHPASAGAGSSAVSAVHRAARRGSDRERLAAVTALATMERADAALVDLAGDERSPAAVRVAALRGLTQRVRPQPAPALRQFLPVAARLSRRDAKQPEDVRVAALNLLGAAGGHESALIAMGTDAGEPEAVRLAALAQLAGFNTKPLTLDAARALGVFFHLKEPSRRIRLIVLAALERGTEEHRNVLRRVLLDPLSDPELAAAALGGLARQVWTLAPGEVELLATALADTRRDPSDRARAISAFASAGLGPASPAPKSPAIAARVSEALRLLAIDRREALTVRLAAVDQLPTLAPEGSAAVTTLVGLVRDRSESHAIRLRTASALYRIRVPWAWQDLAALVRETPQEATLRRTALEAITNTVNDRALASLLRDLAEQDAEPTVRDVALRGMARFLQEPGVAALLESELLQRGGDDAQRVSAAWALARGDVDRARQVFARIPADEPSRLVRWAVSTYARPGR